MKYHATVYLTVVHSFEVEAESRDEAELLSMDIGLARAGMNAASVGVDSVHVMEMEEAYASTSAS